MCTKVGPQGTVLGTNDIKLYRTQNITAYVQKGAERDCLIAAVTSVVQMFTIITTLEQFNDLAH